MTKEESIKILRSLIDMTEKMTEEEWDLYEKSLELENKKYYKEEYHLSYIPSCCKGCPNHPSNGGSGICNCALPEMTRTVY